MIDTHCHISCDYYSDIDNLIDKIKTSGVECVITNGCNKKSNLEVLELVNNYDSIYGAIGLHPTELSNNVDDDLKWVDEHINYDKIVALGEIGLDYHYPNYDKELQQYAFKKQLEIAEKYNKPVIVHSRDAIEDTYNILSQYNVKGVIHSFSSSLEMAKKFIKLGYKIGVGGVVTFKNGKKIQEIVKNIDLKHILIETDSPYLSPEPLRGKRNEPKNVYYVAKKISEIKNLDISLVLEVTNNNAISQFDLDI